MRCKIATVVLLVALCVGSSIGAENHAAAAFKKMQLLAGDWVGKNENGMDAKTTFSARVANTTVMETLAISGMDEMVTFYHVDRDAITLVHYCPTNNQPRMRAVPDSEDVKELKFLFAGAENLPSLSVGHQHQLTLRFEDSDHITETWVWQQDGHDTPITIQLTRKKN